MSITDMNTDMLRDDEITSFIHTMCGIDIQKCWLKKYDTIIYNPFCDNWVYSGKVLLLINNDDTRDFYINDNVIVVDNNMDIKRLIIDVGNNGGDSEMDAGDISVKVYVKGSDTALRYIFKDPRNKMEIVYNI